MSVLVIVQGIPLPERSETMKQYQTAALPVIQKHGGQIVARGAGRESLVGEHKWAIGVVFRFQDIESVRAWYHDPAYQKVIPLRDQSYAQLEINVFEE